MKSSIGYHTFALYKGLSPEDETKLDGDFFSYMRNNCPMNMSIKRNKMKQPIATEYSYKNNTGIRWRVINWLTWGNHRITGVKAIITPEVLLNKDDTYTKITTNSDIQEIKVAFNNEAHKISPILGDFDSCSLNRVDYCANFYLDELKIPCTPERMMKLIKMGDIPAHYEERTKYDPKSHRKKTSPISFYLVSGSVVVNCYDKEAQLKNDEKYPCENIEAAKNLIRFEIQCKNQKLHAMWKNHMYVESEPEPSTSTFSNEEEVDVEVDEFIRKLEDQVARLRPILPKDVFLSNAICVEVIDKYFRKIVRSGDYYTFEKAQHMIKKCRFHYKKEMKLIRALVMTNMHRGIHKTKLLLKDEDLLEYNLMLIELDKLGINPVTIPRAWRIEYIPNLFNAYHNKRAEL